MPVVYLTQALSVCVYTNLYAVPTRVLCNQILWMYVRCSSPCIICAAMLGVVHTQASIHSTSRFQQKIFYLFKLLSPVVVIICDWMDHPCIYHNRHIKAGRYPNHRCLQGATTLSIMTYSILTLRLRSNLRHSSKLTQHYKTLLGVVFYLLLS